MKKFIALFLAVLLVSGTAYAVTGQSPAGQNVVIQRAVGAQRGESQVTVIIPVRYGRSDANSPSLTSGDVMTWDLVSQDGYTVSICQTDNDPAYAGVLVTPMLTDDTAGTFEDTGRNWGYMAVRGYVLAKVDSGAAIPGDPIVPNGGTLIGSFVTIPDVQAGQSLSADLGVLLGTGASDGLHPVWLK